MYYAPPRRAALAPPRSTRFATALAFAGPAFLVSVGYMDPGNWGTDLAAGSRFGYSLLWLLVVANVVALFLQYLSAKLGIATGRDLAALVGERSTVRRRRCYAVLAVLAMLATETAEFLGVVTALRLLLGLPLVPAIVLGAVLVLGLLLIGTGGRTRPQERVIFGLLGVVGIAYVIELWLAPPRADVLGGLVPGNINPATLPVIIGIVGAVVMPHNLFLHSGLILSRRRADVAPRRLVRRAVIESAVALNLALLVNAAILIMAATTFHGRVEVDSLTGAHQTLTPLLGAGAAGVFALALLAAGLSSSVTGGLATQYVVRGLVRPDRPLSPALSRLVGLVPAVAILLLGVGEITALLWSQIVLAIVLPTVVVPLVLLSRDRALMGELADGRRTRAVALAIATVLSTLSLAGLAGIVGLY